MALRDQNILVTLFCGYGIFYVGLFGMCVSSNAVVEIMRVVVVEVQRSRESYPTQKAWSRSRLGVPGGCQPASSLQHHLSARDMRACQPGHAAFKVF
jgi:hypothetical protein